MKSYKEWEENKELSPANKLKKRIFDFYGWECNCCKENEKKFLTIDHIYNDGFQDKSHKGFRRSGYIFYKSIIDNNYPKTYQILCWNCNCGKQINGGICPHNGGKNTTGRQISGKKHKLKPKHCLICKKKLRKGKMFWKKKFCSDNCRIKNYYKKIREGYLKNLG